MRLKWLTNFNTLLLVTVCLALGATLWWSQRALERPYQMMERYLGLSQQFQNQAARNIQVYLAAAMPCAMPPHGGQPAASGHPDRVAH